MSYTDAPIVRTNFFTCKDAYIRQQISSEIVSCASVIILHVPHLLNNCYKIYWPVFYKFPYWAVCVRTIFDIPVIKHFQKWNSRYIKTQVTRTPYTVSDYQAVIACRSLPDGTKPRDWAVDTPLSRVTYFIGTSHALPWVFVSAIYEGVLRSVANLPMCWKKLSYSF